MKRICVAIDYSPSAQKVASIGNSYAKTLNAEISLVHVIADPVYYAADYTSQLGFEGFYGLNNVAQEKSLIEAASSFLAKHAEKLDNKKVSTKVLEGDTATAILDYAKKWQADLLVLGTHSHSTLENILIGNVATKIVKHTSIPLLVIPIRESE